MNRTRLHQISWKRMDSGDWHIKIAGIVRSGFARPDGTDWIVGLPMRDRIHWTRVARLAEARSILTSWWLTNEEFVATAESQAYEAELMRLAQVGRDLGVPQPETMTDDPRVSVERRVTFTRAWIETSLDRAIRRAGLGEVRADTDRDFPMHVALATRSPLTVTGDEHELDQMVISEARRAKSLL